MKIAAIVQARTSSTRLPKKVIKELPKNSEVTCLEHVIRRLKKCKKLNEIIVATTNEKEDDIIIDIAEKENVKYFRGSKDNVLSRYYHTALKNCVDIIVRVTSDCPCIDPKVVDKVISNHLNPRTGINDYTANNVYPSYPKGLDVEVFNFEVLEKAFHEAQTSYEKEHVTPYIRNNPDKFATGNVYAPRIYNYPRIRVTLDTERDYEFLCKLFAKLYYKDEFFSVSKIITFCKKYK